MKNFVSSMDNLPKILKVVLALPLLDIVWTFYRIFKSAATNNMIGVILGVLLLVVGIPFLWLIDMVTIILSNKVIWLE